MPAHPDTQPKAVALLWQKTEALLIFITALVIFAHLNSSLSWWAALLLFFVPDISFSGYFFGPKVGAFCYNAAHLYACGAILFGTGMMMNNPFFMLAGCLWLAHSGFDRMLGYGLKSPEGFSLTHLGQIGKKQGN
ncbi:DUF4260 domain-containing protein [Rahnella sp. AA]|uniref:DUF4260 domain-containing protein n=1 Tax=Rahnella sp. AA TaxID=2057180 RepID=UPI000C3292C1|nr:DUF4260 domain-containing protein [Rahnella sp. AA]PKE28906.1 DUF4260 domain-containing protein [Rahnella sp. AA]